MIKNKKIFLLVIIVLIFLTVIYFLNYFLPIFRFYPKEPDFEPGTQWVSSTPEMSLSANEEGFVNGILYLNGEEYEVVFSTKAGTAVLSIYESNARITVLIGKYRITRKGDIIIKKFSIEEPTVDISSDKIVLAKVG